MDAKSALNYAATYYENADLPKIIDPKTNGEEYILMKDTVGGTTEEGAEVTSVSADTSAYKTVVHAVYDKAKSEITLRAYADVYKRQVKGFALKTHQRLCLWNPQAFKKA